jgi:hypothetical protein
MFVKLDTKTPFKSIWREDSDTRIVWITLLMMADATGLVEASITGISDLARVNIENTQNAIEKFMSPDPNSSNMNNDGKRVSRVQGGYQILNYQYYREKDHTGALRQKRFREKCSNDAVTEHNGCSASVSVSYSDMFSLFWKEYPKKANKLYAETVFKRLKPNDELFKKIMSALEWQKKSDQWLSDGGRYIPLASTWINKRRWEDEKPTGNYSRLDVGRNDAIVTEPTLADKIQHKKSLIDVYEANCKLNPGRWEKPLEKLREELKELENGQEA